MHSRLARMARPGPWAIVFAFVVTGLAGCTGSSPEPIAVDNAGAPGGPGPYTFTAKVSSENDNYTWDLGDHLTTLYGKSVTHTFDVKNGALTVSLKVQRNGTAQVYSRPLQLGTGTNANPAFVLDAQTNWAVLGEPVTFSAARSVDADGDAAPRYSWSCLEITSDANLTRKPVHSHPVIGTPYQTPPAGSVTSYRANFTLPAADTIFPGDLCQALAGGTRPSTTAATIQGSFTHRGKYAIFLVASDGAHPTVSGSYDLYVTSPGERPAEWQLHWFNATLKAGAGGQLQAQCSTLPGGAQTCDQHSGNFALELAGQYGWVNVTYDAGAQGTNNVTWELRRGGGGSEGALVAGSSCADATTKLPGSCANPDSRLLTREKLIPAQYNLTATLQRGGNTNVTMQVAVRLNVDPFSVY